MLSTNTLGRYTIIRELARSNDIVYEAVDPARGKKIALKELQIPPNLVGSARQERVQRFTREARAAASLRHTNIVQVLDFGQVQNRHFIAMEYLEGQSLRDVLRQRGALPLQEALRIAAAVADGLEYAHQHGVVHRDVKPDNVHLEPDGRVVITDFGIARLMFEPTLTADGQIFGTPSYMSPEQVTGKGIDKRSDIFSLGIMLYEMVAGRKPFTGDSVITITYNIMNMELPPLPGVPAGVDQVIRRATGKEASQRYRAAREMAEDLRSVAGGGTPRNAGSLPQSPQRQSPPPSGFGSPPPSGFASPQPPSPRPQAPRPAMPPPPAQQYRPPSPVPGPVQGARPIALPPLPQGGTAPRGPAAGPAPMAAARPMPAYVAPPDLHVNPRNQRRSGGSWDVGWFVGWLGFAVVVGLIILAVVWASVKAYDGFQHNSAAVSAVRGLEHAKAERDAGRLESALKEYERISAVTGGANRIAALKSGANAAVDLAKQRLDANQAEQAEAFARQALKLNPDSVLAYADLGSALSRQGNVEAAISAFDEIPNAVQRLEAADAPAEEVQQARQVAQSVSLWKAEAYYTDGMRQKDRDPMLARTRFDQVIQTSPASNFGQAARTELERLSTRSGSSGAGAGAANSANAPAGGTTGGDPGTLGTGTLPGRSATPNPPVNSKIPDSWPGWDNPIKSP